jgi:ParB family transcriptional regulator, chromosome partitioning protein
MNSSRRQKSLSNKRKTPTSQANKGLESIAKEISITAIKLPKKQPRRSFNLTKMQHLTESVRNYGILEPLIVRPLNSQVFELVAGERRYRAAKEVGLTEVPVIIRDLDEKEAFELALLENLQRDDLNPIDETEGMLQLLCQSLNCNHDDVISLLNQASNAQRRNLELTDNVTRQIEIVDQLFLSVGRINRESYRTNRLPLLNLPDDVLRILREGELEYTKAKVIAKLESEEQRQKLMKQVIEEKMSLKHLKEKVNELQDNTSSSDANNNGDIQISSLKKQIKLLNEKYSTVSSSSEGKLRAKYVYLFQVESDAWSDKLRLEKLESILSDLEEVLDVKRGNNE